MNTSTALARNSPRMNTYAIAAAKYCGMCSYEKSLGGGRVSGRFAGFGFLETNLSRVNTYAKLADNSCRMCTCEPLGPQPSLESTLAEKTGWGPPTEGFFRP